MLPHTQRSSSDDFPCNARSASPAPAFPPQHRGGAAGATVRATASGACYGRHLDLSGRGHLPVAHRPNGCCRPSRWVAVGAHRATRSRLNSLENRVYEVELEDGERLVAKFYRPGRLVARGRSSRSTRSSPSWPRRRCRWWPPIRPGARFPRSSSSQGARLAAGQRRGRGNLRRGTPRWARCNAGEGRHLVTRLFPKVRGPGSPPSSTTRSSRGSGRLVGAAAQTSAGPAAAATVNAPSSRRRATGAGEPPACCSAGPWLPLELASRPRAPGVRRDRIGGVGERAFEGVEAIRVPRRLPPRESLVGPPPGPMFVDFDDFLSGPADPGSVAAVARSHDAEGAAPASADGGPAYEDHAVASDRLVALAAGGAACRALRIMRYAAVDRAALGYQGRRLSSAPSPISGSTRSGSGRCGPRGAARAGERGRSRGIRCVAGARSGLSVARSCSADGGPRRPCPSSAARGSP